jgi:hypothetical protein
MESGDIPPSAQLRRRLSYGLVFEHVEVSVAIGPKRL